MDLGEGREEIKKGGDTKQEVQNYSSITPQMIIL